MALYVFKQWTMDDYNKRLHTTIGIITALYCLYACVYCQRINTHENRQRHHRTQINEFLIDKHSQIRWVYAGVIICIF